MYRLTDEVIDDIILMDYFTYKSHGGVMSDNV